MGSNADPQPQPETAGRPWVPWAIGASLLLAGVAVGWAGPALLLKPLAGGPPTTESRRPITPVDRAAGPTEPATGEAKPGQSVQLIWVLHNTGNTTWAPHSYSFAPVDGVGTIPVLPLPSGPIHNNVIDYIQPEERVTVIANLTAPADPGLWQISWQLMGPAGPVPGGLIKGVVTVAP